MTAVLEIQGQGQTVLPVSSRPVIFSSGPTSRNERRGQTTFCHPVSSGALGSPSAGPYWGPRPLLTLPGNGGKKQKTTDISERQWKTVGMALDDSWDGGDGPSLRYVGQV